eukprot:TRINITY_DN21903_c0_g1_i1.p1 TRINITY_DN21903_c0_g1~~TRINITY_DN21903_c0_g1_i1.p1  ORF type:complete len:559 (+),score=161.21 TRINITY_DN21903_c0_g1_i1:88-1764(+)
MGVSGGKERATDLKQFFETLRAAKQKQIQQKIKTAHTIVQKLAECSDSEQGLRDLLKSIENLWEQEDEELTARLRPHVERAFARYDKDKNGRLDPLEAQLFFRHYVQEAHAMGEAMTATVMDCALEDSIKYLHSNAGQAIKQLAVMRSSELERRNWESEMQEAVAQARKEAIRELKDMMDDYLADQEARHTAAFKVLDTDNDGGLCRMEVIKGLLPGSAHHSRFCRALGFVPPKSGNVHFVPGLGTGRNPRLLFTEFFELQRAEFAGYNAELRETCGDLEASLAAGESVRRSAGELNDKLRVFIGELFDAYDKDRNGTLDQKESHKFFDDFVAEFGLMSDAMAEQMAFTSLLKAVGTTVHHSTRGKGTIVTNTSMDQSVGVMVEFENGEVHKYKQGSVGRGKLSASSTEKLKQQLAEQKRMQREYAKHRRERHAAAFRVLDADGGGSLQREEVAQGLLPGTERNAAFCLALGFAPLREAICSFSPRHGPRRDPGTPDTTPAATFSDATPVTVPAQVQSNVSNLQPAAPSAEGSVHADCARAPADSFPGPVEPDAGLAE